MNSSSDISEKRKERLVKWLKNRNNLILIGIILLALVLRLYYFDITNSQPLWWDEADYMAYAKNLAGLPTTWIVSSQHNSIYPFFAAILIKLGLSEEIMKFLLGIIPSFIVVILVYIISRSMYTDKRLALINTFLMAIIWEVLFNSMRFHVDIPALLLGFIAIYVFWQGYEKQKPLFGKINYRWAIPLTVFFTILTYSTRRGYFVFGFFFLVYMLATRKWNDLLKDRYNWIGLVLAIIMILVIESLVFLTPITQVAGKYSNPESSFNLLPLNVFKAFFMNNSNAVLSPLLYLFWIGLILIIAGIVLSFGYIKKSKNPNLKADIFFLITILVTLSYFLFYQQAQGDFGEARWYFPLLFGAIVCISRSTLFISDHIKKYSKILAIVFILALIGYGGYAQVMQADSSIKYRASSFQGIKDVSLSVNSLSVESDVILGYPTPQIAYYTERTAIEADWRADKPLSELTPEEFIQMLKDNPDIKYLIISMFDPAYPPWMAKVNYARHPQTGQPVMVSWQLPLTNSSIDFVNNVQDIKPGISYGDIAFQFKTASQDTFAYEIIRQ